MIMQKMADKGRPDVCVVLVMNLCKLKLKHASTTLLFEVLLPSNRVDGLQELM